MIGSTLSHYSIESELGRGGHGHCLQGPGTQSSTERWPSRCFLQRLWHQPNRFVGFDTTTESFSRQADVPSGGGTIRHMYFDEETGMIWFGADANTIGRALVSPREGS